MAEWRNGFLVNEEGALIVAAGVPDADAETTGGIRLAGDLGGTAEAPEVVKLGGLALPTDPPETGNVLTFDGTNLVWAAP